VVKEYTCWVEGLNFVVKSRVTRDPKSSTPYRWEVSHHYKPSESAGGQYYPSTTSAKTFEEAEALMKVYLLGFTTIGVEPTRMY
jgi:hypothetical protein